MKNDLAAIAVRIRAHQGTSTVAIVEIGLLLNEAAETLPHGDLMAWVDREFDFSYRTARRYRDAAAAISNWPNWQIWARNLSKSSLYAFVDSTPEARQAIKSAAESRFVNAVTANEIIDSVHAARADCERAIYPDIIAPAKLRKITIAPVDGRIFKIANSGDSIADLAVSVSESDLDFAINFLRDIRRAQGEATFDRVKDAADRADARSAEQRRIRELAETKMEVAA